MQRAVPPAGTPRREIRDRTAARSSPDLPLFAQVREHLRRAILDGRLAAGQRLPSESALMAEHRVSRITVRQALAELQTCGLIETLNGKGSFVTRADHATTLGPLVGILEAMRKRGHQAQARLISHKVVAASPTLTRLMDLAPGERLGALTLLRLVDGEPLAIGISYFAPALAARLAREDLHELDVATVLAGRLGLRPAETRCSLAAVAASRVSARRLGCEPGAPLLRIRTHSFDYQRRPIAWSQTDCRGDRMDYRVSLRS